MADNPLRASLATKGERRAALRARLADAGDGRPPETSEGSEVSTTDAPPAPAPSVVTQGVRTGAPGPAEPRVDDWIREMAGSRRRGGGGVWSWP